MGEAPTKTFLYLVRVTKSQEPVTSLILANKADRMGNSIKSILSLEELPGYLVIEAERASDVDYLIANVPHVKGRVPSFIPLDELSRFLKRKSYIEELSIGDVVRITSGPFEGEKARVVSIRKSKDEVTVELFESLVPVAITVPGDSVKKEKSKES